MNLPARARRKMMNMKIVLDSNPSDAPGCLKIVAEDGRDILIQTDWDWPGVASTFGWTTTSKQRCRECGHIANVSDCRDWACSECGRVQQVCNHRGTDGTVNCPDCTMDASAFIAAAREWLDEHDGAEAEDPGYFEAAEPVQRRD